MEKHIGIYPTPMTSNPSVWGYDYKNFLYPIFAIYYEKYNRFGMFRVRVAESYHIIEPYKTERNIPFYFHATGNPEEPPTEVYIINSQFSFCTWFQKGWLCKKNGTGMSPVFPVMKISNCAKNCSYTKHCSVAIYESPAAIEWVDRVKRSDKAVSRLAVRNAVFMPYSYAPPKAVTPRIPALPAYVTTLLLEDAIAKKQDCPITMEPITKEFAAVTSCYHVFDRDAIASWLTSHTTCPVCKQTCCLPP